MENSFLIYEGKFWEVILNAQDQYFLGRSIVKLKRDIEDPLAITKKESEELWWDILPRLNRALEKSFSVDRINYSHLANSWNHVHWHIIPRYEKNPAREFCGEKFVDEFVGHNPFNGVPEKKLSVEILEKIAEEITKNF